MFKRVGKVIVGLLFLILMLLIESVVLAAFSGFALMMLWNLGADFEDGEQMRWLLLVSSLVIVNAGACWRYFARPHIEVRLRKPFSIVYIVPRALDLIWRGSERGESVTMLTNPVEATAGSRSDS